MGVTSKARLRSPAGRSYVCLRVLLAAALFAHDLVALRVHVPAWLGGDGCWTLVGVGENTRPARGHSDGTALGDDIGRPARLSLPGTGLWRALRYCLQDESLRQAIEALRPRHARTASMLRLVDVALWMLHSESTAARNARDAAGVTPQR